MGKINFRKYFLQNKRSANAAISRKKIWLEKVLKKKKEQWVWKYKCKYDNLIVNSWTQ